MAPPANLDILLVQIQYPGMTHVESEITRAWLRARGAQYDSVEFNVRLGEGAALQGLWSDETRRMALLLSQKRADAIARQGEVVEIVEVKVRAGLAAVGQLRGYRALYLREHPATIDVRLLVIARSCDPDSAYVYSAEGVRCEEYPRVILRARV